jgi:hypothetical protein
MLSFMTNSVVAARERSINWISILCEGSSEVLCASVLVKCFG